MKTVKVNDKEYPIKANAYVYKSYRTVFNRGIFEDLQILENYIIAQELVEIDTKKKFPEAEEKEINAIVTNAMLNKLDDFMEAVTRVLYILIYAANDKIEDYDTFLKNIQITPRDTWIAEVTEFAVDCFCG